MARVRKYSNKDFPMVAGWCKMRGLPIPDKHDFSDMGFVVDNRVAGFLYLTTSNLAMIDMVIASPHTVPSLRRESLQVLYGVLVDTAIMLGYPKIMAHIAHPSVAVAAGNMGFVAQEHKLYTLSVEDMVTDEDENCLDSLI